MQPENQQLPNNCLLNFQEKVIWIATRKGERSDPDFTSFNGTNHFILTNVTICVFGKLIGVFIEESSHVVMLL